MADITDIKAILYTEKTIELQENGVVVVQTSPRMTKSGLKEVFLGSVAHAIVHKAEVPVLVVK